MALIATVIFTFIPISAINSVAQANSGKHRVIVSTDIGGSDPDDFQSMVHFLVYADTFDIEGLVSSPPDGGRASHIRATLDEYEKDYAAPASHNSGYPTPEYLRSVTVQGATTAQSNATPLDAISSGAQHIIDRAHVSDNRPLWILVWGSITDVAQAVHKDPSIKEKIRIYSIGSWNTRQDPKARDYLYNNHNDLWWIESNTTFRGMYKGGDKSGDYGNTSFVSTHVRGHGALGDFFYSKKSDIKMGDTPSVLYLLHGDADDPTSDSWGGRYRATSHGANYWTDRTESSLEESGYDGAKTVNQWRTDYLDDWARRMDRVIATVADTLNDDAVTISGVPQGYEPSVLGPGVEYYTDRSYTISSVPADLEGYAFIKTANNDAGNTSGQLCFDIDGPATLYIAYDNRATALPEWLSTWTKTDLRIECTDAAMGHFDLYRNIVSSAQTICLGANMASPASGGGSMYLVIAVPAPATAARKFPALSHAEVSNRGTVAAFDIRGRMLSADRETRTGRRLSGPAGILIVHKRDGRSTIRVRSLQ
ncbi:MAG: DUF1593 domain-containing protein [Chitinivibrionales bacterium]|nr:DUF1593 domain-containing protein [Chitinivibrionales bacterium]